MDKRRLEFLLALYVKLGADLGFSLGRGGGVNFPSSPNALKRRCFGQIFCTAGKFLKKKKQVKNAVFGHFLENVDKKNAFFFGARSPSKLVYIGSEGAFRKILGSVGQK